MSHKQLRYPPLFIVGPPRSGTTLLGQVVEAGLDVAHIPTFAVRKSRYFSHRPPLILLTRVARLLELGVAGTAKFESTYGASNHLGAASDSDPIWRKALPEGYLEKGVLPPRTRDYVYRQFSGIERIFGRPLVDKSVGHSLRIPALLEIFDDAMFVRCRRDVTAVAQSVWIGRGQFPNARWPTPKVRGFDVLQWKCREEQAAGQQFLFEKDIDAGLSDVPSDRVIEVDYADVCSSPEREVQRIRNMMLTNGVAAKKCGSLPDHFDNHNLRRIPEEVYLQIIDYLEQYWSREVTRLNEPSLRV